MYQYIKHKIAALRPGQDFDLRPCKNPSWGDYACNIALLLPGDLMLNAQGIVDVLKKDLYFAKVWIANKGFINIHLRPDMRYAVIGEILQKDKAYRPIVDDLRPSDQPQLLHLLHRVDRVLAQLPKQLVQYEFCGLDTRLERTLLFDLAYFLELKDDKALKKFLHHFIKRVHGYFDVITLLCEYLPQRYTRLCFLQAIRCVLSNSVKLLYLDG